jgi:hypothetical protein
MAVDGRFGNSLFSDVRAKDRAVAWVPVSMVCERWSMALVLKALAS